MQRYYLGAVMSLFFLFVFLDSTHTELHSLNITFTGVSGIPALPDYTSLTTVDGIEVDYYDSNINKLISKQEWIKKPIMADFWKQVIENHDYMYQTFLEFVNDTKHSCNEEGCPGVHTYQEMCSCVWNDVTGSLIGWFDKYGNDGTDFSSVDLNTESYIPHVQQAVNISQKWNKKHQRFRHYYIYKCEFLLTTFLKFGKAVFERTDQPEVSLLQRNSSSPVVCLATGFFPAAVNISWEKSGQNHHEDVETEETHPNGDGTFQKRIALRVKTEEWHKNQYSCVVQHKSLTKDIQKILTDDEIKTNSKSKKNWSYPWIIPVIVIVFVVMSLIAYMICKRRSKTGTFNMMFLTDPIQLESEVAIHFLPPPPLVLKTYNACD